MGRTREGLKGKVRVCDGKCHNAKKPDCDCWCGGMFHGARGSAARDAFKQAWGGEIPREGEPQQLDFGGAERWHAAVAAARAAAGQGEKS
jgi:hypothetical protein